VDLAECLIEENISAALLDVLKEEPAPLNHPFYQIRTCKITPHLAWASVQSRAKLMKSVEENISGFLNGNPKNLIN
jgi:glycerate dehydrogenase